MQKYNILVTGIGAIIGYGIIQSLRKSKYDVYIVGMDIYEDAYGRSLADEFIQAVPAADPKYVDFVKQTIRDKKIDLVMFGTEQEIHRLMSEKEALGDDYNKLVLNNSQIINISEDKWKTYEFLKTYGFDVIPTRIEGTFEEIAKEFGLPFLIKPRKSYASKGIEKIYTKEDFDFFRKRVGEQFMVQKIVGDIEHEYTVAVFGYGNGMCTRPIMMKRKLSQEGATAKAQIVEIPEIEQNVKKMAEILKPQGPTNFQFRFENGKYLLLETNPRISSSTSLRTAFGYNEAEMCIEYFVEGKCPQVTEIKKGTAVRYIADYIRTEC